MARFGPGSPAGGGFKGNGKVAAGNTKGMKALPKSGHVTGPIIGPQMVKQPIQTARKLS